ncbi:hypothetical protein KQX54_001873 [Cotesia glomerata]|uniref:Uncharacterized protein n=1 Tax=Cotesia glomerata TaxID=32391 RepID=A0AAV7HZJ5_COTGL|nr:hypothetical protein KQX54_001873 [Cotesia glomerata]
MLTSNSHLVQEFVSSGGFAKHESFESLDVTPQRELVTNPSISEEEVLNSDGSYSAHQDELVNDSSSTVDGVLLDHANSTVGPPMDNDGKLGNFESSIEQFVTRRDLDVAVQKDSAPPKDLNNRVFKRRRRCCNNFKKPSDGTMISDEAVHNLTTQHTNGGNASKEVSTSTVSSDSCDQKHGSSDAKSEVVEKRRRRRRRRPSKKTKASGASLVASNVVYFSPSTRRDTNRSANNVGESAFGFAWSKSAVKTRLTRRHGTCLEYPDQVSQIEKDGRPSSYAYNPVYNVMCKIK